MRVPIRPVRGRWPTRIERFGPLRRFFRRDPLTILDENAHADAYRQAMDSIYVGNTIKVTGSARHRVPDQLLIDTVALEGARIVDLGASDGSTSVDLAERVDDFGEFVIADLHLTVTVVTVGRWHVLFDTDGECILVGSRRLSAWPELSRPVAALFASVIRRGRERRAAEGREVVLLNPDTRRLIAADERISARVHDVFTVWGEPRPDVIKVANLLRRLYFCDDDLVRALHAVRDSLPEGGHLMVVDNPRIPGVVDPPPRAGIWQRDGDRLVEVARAGDPEIADLVELVGTAGVPK